ncbi:hypothetical protein O3M35_006192 [Rhynocoris fuscipes]|uniref:Uncharacterized protein n=1 Tax=Rhynocoris fuscipes TaxID=488301 RepID=A0AAW1DCH6_9HEMI
MQGSQDQELSGGENQISNPMEAASVILNRLDQLHNEFISFKTEAKLEYQQTIQTIPNLEVSITSSIKALEDDFSVIKKEFELWLSLVLAIRLTVVTGRTMPDHWHLANEIADRDAGYAALA